MTKSTRERKLRPSLQLSRGEQANHPMRTHHRAQRIFLYLGGLALVASVIVWSVSQSAAGGSAAAPVVLFTRREARTLRMTEREWRNVSNARAISTGPTIVVRRPQLVPGDVPTIETQSPTDLDVIFEPRDAPVRMDSLNVEARKGFFSRSLTDLVRPYVHGDSIEMTNVEIPSGRFMLDISIADTSGNITDATYRLEVGGQ